jgi:hypothetical protein
MKESNVNSLGYDLKVLVPDSVEEYDRLARKDGACFESATNNVLYRSTLAKFRDALCQAIENNTGIARETEPTGRFEKDDEGKDTDTPVLRYVETEAVFFKRVCATLAAEGKFPSPEAAAASFADLAQETISGIAFNPSERERAVSGPKTVAKQYTKLAQEWVDAGQADRRVAQFKEKLGATWTVEATVESLARAISEDQRRKREASTLKSEYES